jgi:hypothetical protein
VRTALPVIVAISAALGACAPGPSPASGPGPGSGEGRALEVALTVPATIQAGKLFTFVVEVRNPHDTALALDRIHMDDALAAPLQLISVQPMPERMAHEGGVHSWSFREKVPSRGSLRVVYRLRAPREGRFQGTVEACSSGGGCAGAPAEWVVSSASPP